MPESRSEPRRDRNLTTLFLCGDVMTGRGIDQILPHPSEPWIHESHIQDARDYVELAERVSGPIPRPADAAYVWGDALPELERVSPDARIINLETSVTVRDLPWPDKEVHYRMHPANVPCLTAAKIDVCALANNHVLDYGHAGLMDTLDTLRRAGLKTAGAGRDLAEARRPAAIELAQGSILLVYAFGSTTSGIPRSWAATPGQAGVDLLPDLSAPRAAQIGERVRALKRPGDIVVASVHWGSNWGYSVPSDQVRFAHRLIEAGVDVVHGHSSHHPRPIEIYRKKLVLYGCGDFINDYEGITGFEDFRGELGLMYFVTLDTATGELVDVRMTPMKARGFRLVRASNAEGSWLRDVLHDVGGERGTRVESDAEGRLVVRAR